MGVLCGSQGTRECHVEVMGHGIVMWKSGDNLKSQLSSHTMWVLGV